MSFVVLLGAAAGACAAAAIVEWLGAPQRPATRAGAERAARHGNRGGRALSRIGAMTVLLARLARRAGVRAAPGDLEARVAAAGAPLGLAVGDIVALKGAAALGLTLFLFPVAGVLPGRLGVAMLLAAPFAGFFAPELVLARRARSRANRIAGELADVLDLLRVAIGAGLPVGRAMGRWAGG
jgi:tight adherence protein C